MSQDIFVHFAEQNAIRVGNRDLPGATLLSVYPGQSTHIIRIETGDNSQSLIPETRSPDRKDIALIILIHSILKNILGIVGPLILNVDGHLPSREHHPINLRQQILQLSRIEMPEDRHDLSASHLHGLDIGGGDVGVVLVARVVGVLGVDTDHWGLLRQAQGNGQQARQQC